MRWRSRITPDNTVLAGMLLAAAVYCRDLQYSFILDDVSLILTNDTIASWRNWKTLFHTHIFYNIGVHLPVPYPAEHYRPIYMLWMMLNEQLFGGIVPWWHLSSLLLHICVVYLVYQLGLRLLKEPWTAALAALLFAFHPIHVESVSYVSASTDLLVTLFLLVSLLTYMRFREVNASPAFFAVSLLTAGLAMLSKETAAVFPFVLMAYEATRDIPAGTKRNWTQFAWTLPYFAIVAAYSVTRTALFGRNIGPGPGGNRLVALADLPLVLIVYLRNFVWFIRLSFFYPVEWASHWTPWKGTAAVIVVAVAAALWVRYRSRPGVRLQLLWTAILFIPALSAVAVFVKEDWVHDRHMYLVSVPFCLLAAAVLTDAKLPRQVSMIASLLILAFLLVETGIGVPRFKDENAIYLSTFRVDPQNTLAHRYYAFALWNNGDYEKAFSEFRIVEELTPWDAFTYAGHAAALAEVGRNDEAATEFAAALRYSPDHTLFRAFLLYRLAESEVRQHQPADGEAHLREALQIAPETLGYHAMLAQALREEGHAQEADAEMIAEADVRRLFAQKYPTR